MSSHDSEKSLGATALQLRCPLLCALLRARVPIAWCAGRAVGCKLVDDMQQAPVSGGPGAPRREGAGAWAVWAWPQAGAELREYLSLNATLVWAGGCGKSPTPLPVRIPSLPCFSWNSPCTCCKEEETSPVTFPLVTE